MTITTGSQCPAAFERPAEGRIGVFYALATAIALVAWIPYGAQLAGVLPGHIPAIVPVAGQYSPTIAALILVASEGRFVAFLKRSLNPLFALRWYAVALFIPPLMGACLIAVQMLRGIEVPSLLNPGELQSHIVAFFTNIRDASGGASNAVGGTLSHWASMGLVPALLTVFAVALFNGGVSEEAGWRGYMLDGMFRGRRPLVAALLVGFCWGLWHTGPAFWAGIFQANWAVFAIPLEYVLGAIPLTVMIAWVFLNAKGSLLPGMLLHACYNFTFFFLTQIWSPQHPVVTVPEWLTASYAAAFAVAIAGRHTLLVRQSA
jgi:membrane protease YdiL (CAAX protease family)